MELKVGQEVFIRGHWYSRKGRIKSIGRKYVHTENGEAYLIRDRLPLEGDWNHLGLGIKRLYLSQEQYEDIKAQNLKINDLKSEIDKEIRNYHSVETLEKVLKILKDEEANKSNIR